MHDNNTNKVLMTTKNPMKQCSQKIQITTKGASSTIVEEKIDLDGIRTHAREDYGLNVAP